MKINRQSGETSFRDYVCVTSYYKELEHSFSRSRDTRAVITSGLLIYPPPRLCLTSPVPGPLSRVAPDLWPSRSLLTHAFIRPTKFLRAICPRINSRTNCAQPPRDTRAREDLADKLQKLSFIFLERLPRETPLNFSPGARVSPGWTIECYVTTQSFTVFPRRRPANSNWSIHIRTKVFMTLFTSI